MANFGSPQGKYPPQENYGQQGQGNFMPQGHGHYGQQGQMNYGQQGQMNYAPQGQGNYQASPNAPAKSNWSTGICGCFEDCGNCFLTCCCPCITVGQNIEILDQGKTPCIMGALIYYLVQVFTGCGCIYTFTYRSRMRLKFGLPEEPCGDFPTECCCHPCSICQITRELRSRGIDPSLGYEATRHIYEGNQAPPQQYMHA